MADKTATLTEAVQAKQTGSEPAAEPAAFSADWGDGRKVIATTAAGGIAENAERQGLEVRFSGRPDDDTRAILKQSGFKWHRAGRYWYARQSGERLAAAQTAIRMAAQA